MDALLEKLRTLEIDVRERVLLALHSSFRVGGIARAAAFPASRSQLIQILHAAREHAVRYAVFGNASNVVFSDDGFDGLIIFTVGCKELVCCDGRIDADCGASLFRVAMTAYEHSLCGAEFMHGIPGTVGGAVLMNAGAFEGCVADLCIRSDYWDAQTGQIGSFLGDAHCFGTRTSIYAEHPQRYVVLGASFSLGCGDRVEIRAKMDDYMARRKRTQPLEYPSAGSVFKRPVGHYAGKLIEDCGLKGKTVGGAQVSVKHAGFIINTGEATAADIRALTTLVQETVFCDTGVKLEPEIRFIDSLL